MMSNLKHYYSLYAFMPFRLICSKVVTFTTGNIPLLLLLSHHSNFQITIKSYILIYYINTIRVKPFFHFFLVQGSLLLGLCFKPNVPTDFARIIPAFSFPSPWSLFLSSSHSSPLWVYHLVRWRAYNFIILSTLSYTEYTHKGPYKSSLLLIIF